MTDTSQRRSDSVRVGTLNHNFGRPSRAHRADVRRAIRRHDVDVLLNQELRSRIARTRVPRVVVSQGRQPDLGPSSQAVTVAVRSGVRVRRVGSIPAFGDRYGQQIDWREDAWSTVTHPALGRPTTLISIHVPPRYMWRSPIEEEFGRRLRKLVHEKASTGVEVVVGGDLNHVLRKHGDVLGLGDVGLRKVAGTRIDQIWCTEGLVRVGDPVEIDQRGRRDDHPLVYVDLAARGDARGKPVKR